VAIIFALMLIPLLLAVGIAVDYLRAYQARTALQEVVDAAGLAAGADQAASDAVVIQTAQRYVDANIAPHIQKLGIVAPVTIVTPQVNPVTNKRTIVISASTSLKTTFMRFAYIYDLPLSARTDIQRTEAGPVQVVMVLDATNSMTLPLGSRTRMDVLKEAALSLVNVIMDPPNQGGGIGLVPFALRVNLNGVNLGGPPATWIDIPPDSTWCETSSACWVNCQRDGAAAQCLDMNAPGCVQSTCWPTTWTGCTGYRPKSFRTTLAEQDVAANRHKGVITSAATCAPNTRTIMTSKTQIVSRINAIGTVQIETHIPAGLMWGWNMLTPELPIAGPSKANVEDLGGQRAIVLISDGENVQRPAPSDNGGWWNWQSGQSVADPRDNPDLITEQLCSSIKNPSNDPQIKIFTVLIGQQSQSLVDRMRNCATNDQMAFNTTTANDLLEAFREIGNQLAPVKLLE
jgi:Flp pilus assembly protein TadG